MSLLRLLPRPSRAAAAATAVVLDATLALAQDALPHAPPDPPAAAPDDRDRAERLFDQAIGLVDLGRWDEACPLFRESARAEPAVGSLLNVARCSAREGKVAQAAREYRDVLSLNVRTPDPERRKAVDGQVRELLAKIEPRVPRITVVVAPAVAAATVLVDGERIDRKGAFIEVEVGEHAIVVEAEGFISGHATVSIREGERKTVPVRLERLGQTAPPPPPSALSPVTVAGLVTGQIGLAGLALGGALVAVAADRASEVRQICGPDVDPPSCPRGSPAAAEELAAEGRAFAGGSYAAFAVGGAGLATGLSLILADTAGGGAVVTKASASGDGARVGITWSF
jgi:hypothetical protein